MWNFYYLPLKSGHITLLTLMCDSMHGVLSTREAHPSLNVWYLLRLYLNKHNWSIAHMADFSFQVSWYYVAQSPYSKLHCYDLASSTPINKDYLLGAERKGQTSVLRKFNFFLHRGTENSTNLPQVAQLYM